MNSDLHADQELSNEEREKQAFKEKLRSIRFGTVPGGYKSGKKP